MRFFFDESGDFAIPQSDEHKCGIVCGLVVPETVEDATKDTFKQFVDNLRPEEKSGDEPKGNLLTDESLIRFCDLLKEFRGEILVTPTTLDLSIGSRQMAVSACDSMKTSLFERAKNCVYDTMREEVEELGRQWGNLSTNEALRLVALTSCFWEAIQHSVVLLSEEKYYSCWDPLDFIVDAVTIRRQSRNEVVFERMVLMWLTAWSKRRPLATIAEVHTDGHPFVRMYCPNENRVDLGKILRGNIRFCNSSDSFGLQIADICSNIVYRAVHDLNNWNNRLPIFRLLMRNCPYGRAGGGPGLISLHESNGRIPAEKYRLLKQVMDAAT
jgi:hypothetical protein